MGEIMYDTVQLGFIFDIVRTVLQIFIAIVVVMIYIYVHHMIKN